MPVAAPPCRRARRSRHGACGQAERGAASHAVGRWCGPRSACSLCRTGRTRCAGTTTGRHGTARPGPRRARVAGRCRRYASAVVAASGRPLRPLLAGGPAHQLAPQRIGGIAAPLVLLRRHVGHVGKPLPRLPRSDDRRLLCQRWEGARVRGGCRCRASPCARSPLPARASSQRRASASASRPPGQPAAPPSASAAGACSGSAW
jgi:hypothetical protein